MKYIAELVWMMLVEAENESEAREIARRNRNTELEVNPIPDVIKIFPINSKIDIPTILKGRETYE